MIPFRDLVRFWAAFAAFVLFSGLCWTGVVLLVIWVTR